MAKHEFENWHELFVLAPGGSHTAAKSARKTLDLRLAYGGGSPSPGQHRAPNHCGAYRDRSYIRLLDPASITGVFYQHYEPRPAVVRTAELPEVDTGSWFSGMTGSL